MKFTDTHKSESQRTLTKAGYLVVPATISKVGVFEYHGRELGLQDEQIKKVARTEKSLFSDETLRSFEGAPLTIDHPNESVTADNWKDLAVGTVRNVKRVDDTLAAEAWIYDGNAIKLIQDEGIEELSCGYDCDIVPTTVANADFEMSPMIGNHVALVAKGRCGNSVKLADKETIMGKTVKILDAFLGAFGIKLSDEQKKAVEEEEKKTDEKPDEKGKKSGEKDAEKQPEGKKDDEKPDEKEKKSVKDEALAQENEQLKAQVKALQDAAAKNEAETVRAAVLADAKTVFAGVTFADGATLREIQEQAVISAGIFAKDDATKLSDAELAGAFKAAKAAVQKLAGQNLGSVLLGDSQPKAAQTVDFNELYNPQK